MAWFDVDGFMATLATRGVPDAQESLYRDAVTTLLADAPAGRFSPTMLERALERETNDGATERRLANLRLVGTTMIAYVSELAATQLAPSAPVPRPPSRLAQGSEPDMKPLPLPIEFELDFDRAVQLPTVRVTRPQAIVQPIEAPLPARPGCPCGQREDLELDDPVRRAGPPFAAMIAAITIAAALIAPPFAWLAVAAGLGAIGALAAAAAVAWRCQQCHARVGAPDLDVAQRATKRRRTIGLAAAAVALAVAGVAAASAVRTPPSATIAIPYD